MNELPRKMLLRGHTDYIQFCEGLKNKIAAAWKSGGELQHEEAEQKAKKGVQRKTARLLEWHLACYAHRTEW